MGKGGRGGGHISPHPATLRPGFTFPSPGEAASGADAGPDALSPLPQIAPSAGFQRSDP